LSQLPSPRLFHTHLPYTSVPESIKTSGCRILYITRNPLDTIVSLMHFGSKPMKKFLGVPGIQDYFEEFCAGRIVHGPFFEHVLEYWKLSLEQPNKVLFLKYEDLKENPSFELKKVAQFVGMPFSPEEESQGVIQAIIEMCKINNLKEMEGNKSGVINKFYDKKSYFRKGEIGDWTNYFTPTMEERMKKLMDDKLSGTGLSFQLLPH
ncbi:Cytosolic sulfotransferase 5, partial [Bienertia sinuspersici]